jgi:STE24 endopeptidase
MGKVELTEMFFDQFKTIFLFLFSLKIAIDLSFKIMNFRYLKKHAGRVPPELAELIDAGKLEQIDSYNAVKMRFVISNFIFENILALSFLFTPAFPAYTAWIHRIPLSPVLQGMLFFFIIYSAVRFIELPLEYYYHFRIEARFGFNKYTRAGWLLDCIKEFLVNTAIMGFIAWLALWILGTQFSFSWMKIIYSWLAVFALILAFSYFVPVIITPIFYKLKPVTDESLREKIEKLITQSGLKIKRILVADESQKSTHVNAEFSGFGKNKTIILFDTLLNNYSEAEILAILAHEIGHGKRKHLYKMIVISGIGTFLFILFAAYLLSTDLPFAAFGVNVIYGKFYITYQFFLEIPAFFVHPLLIRFFRKFEYEADAYSKRLLNNAEPLISAFKKFFTLELQNINIHPWYEKMYYSHPSLLKRIQALKSDKDQR